MKIQRNILILLIFYNKVKNESLKTITREERKANIKKLQKCVDELDEITSRYWGDDAPGHGWKQAIDYIELNR